MTVGDTEFTVDAPYYDRLRRQDEYRWAEIARLGRKPAQQFIGNGAMQLEISGEIITVLNPGGGDDYVGMGSLDDLRAAASEGAPLFVIDGMGYEYGNMVVLSVSEEQTELLDNGAARKETFSIVLKEYGEDEA